MKHTLSAGCHHNPNLSQNTFHIRRVKSRYLAVYGLSMRSQEQWQRTDVRISRSHRAQLS